MKFFKLLIAALVALPLYTACSDSGMLEEGPFTPASLRELSAHTWTAPYGSNGLRQIFSFSDITTLPTVSQVNLLPTLLDEFDEEEGEEEEVVELPEIEGRYLSNGNADGFFTYQIVSATGQPLLKGTGLFKLQTETEANDQIDTDLVNTNAPVVLELLEENIELNAAEENASLVAQLKATTLERFGDVEAQSIYWLTGEAAPQQLRINPFGTFSAK